MTLDNALKLLLAGASLCLGSYLTALRAKITSSKIKNKLHYAFYVVTGLFFTSAIISLFCYWDELIFEKEAVKPNYFGLITICFCIAATIILFLFTRKNLIGKYQYKTSELDPVVNSFTKNADKDNIRLLAGDINFFGNSPADMENNSQYECLKKERFREIQILCWKPKTNGEKIRYGKIINDMPEVKIKFYKPPKADLKIRGRLKTLNNVTHLLIYNKIQSGIYEALEIDTANSSGAMYNHLWELIWESAEVPSNEELQEYNNLYRE
jgi:hypothetical protein